MGYRAFRENRTNTSDFAALEEFVYYRIPGVDQVFRITATELARRTCQDCSVPVLTMANKTSAKVLWWWHDDSCQKAPEGAKANARVLNRPSK